tara:strand:- start:42 stop:563 length:522 start_codon:yes stop_codon:yes gene_type:complete
MPDHYDSGFSKAERDAMAKKHAAWKKARKEGKLKEYKATQKATQDKADKKRSDALKAKHKLWKTDRKEYNKQKRAHITKEETSRYDAAQERQDAFNKRTKRGKYSKRHKQKEEKIYGKGWKRNLGRAKRFLSGGALASKEAKADVKNKLKVKRKESERRKRYISKNVEAEMNR